MFFLRKTVCKKLPRSIVSGSRVSGIIQRFAKSLLLNIQTNIMNAMASHRLSYFCSTDFCIVMNVRKHRFLWMPVTFLTIIIKKKLQKLVRGNIWQVPRDGPELSKNSMQAKSWHTHPAHGTAVYSGLQADVSHFSMQTQAPADLVWWGVLSTITAG